MYKAVVFDFDGTIIDTEQHLFEIINKHLQSHQKKPISLAFYRRSIGGAATELHQYLVDTIGADNTKLIYDEHHQTSKDLPMIETIKRLVDFLYQRHIPMAIATSSFRRDIMPTLKNLGLEDQLHAVVGREDVSHVKPDPELYLTAVQQLNYMPTHCLAIEDSVNGASAAVAAGLDVIVNTNAMTETQDFSSVNYIAKDIEFDDIVDYFFTNK